MDRLDIGGGPTPGDGWRSWDIKDGRDARHLDGIADGSLDAIRASHVLEHLPRADTLRTLEEWHRALRLGGELRVAVPDFDYIVQQYQTPKSGSLPLEAWLFGGQIDDDDYHATLFNRRKLTELLGLAGFEVVGDWEGDDSSSCARVACSLNLRAVKRNRRLPLLRSMKDTCAVMSLPRIAWTETMAATVTACRTLDMDYLRATGVFWGQCLTRSFDEIISRGEHEWILTIDFDSVFDAYDIVTLRRIAEESKLDVLCPLQIGRDRESCLMLLDDGNGEARQTMPAAELEEPYLKPLFGHFGLTLIRVEALKRIPRPWFLHHPDPYGGYGDGRVDEDIHFWRQARAAGLAIGITPQVRIGHLQLVVSWPDENLRPVHQYIPEYGREGRP